ncbi:MAG: hypothetical protein QOH21_3227 [Acidobacteriota bacterium]|nr:hypothetical protein [Acidobacteriota bacterium]
MRAARTALFLFTCLTILSAPLLSAQEADITVFKSGPDQAPADSDVTYTVSVTNFGPDTAGAVTLTDALPVGMTFVSETQDSGPVASCSIPAVGDPGTITCTFATFPAAATADFTFVAHIPAGTAPGTVFTNIATVSEVTDPNSENDSGTAVTVTAGATQADLAIEKNGPGSAGADTDVTYTIQLTNSGPGAADKVALNDTLPGTMTFVSFTQDSGPLLTCTTPAAGSGGTVTCTTASFAAGETATFTLTGHIPAQTATGTAFTNTITVSADNDQAEENNVGNVTTVVSSVDLAVTKTAPPTVVAGNDLSYTITVTNSGPDPADNVHLDDMLPSSTTFVSLQQNSGPTASCTTPAVGSIGAVSCAMNVLPPNTPATFTLVVHVGNASALTNSATATTDSFDSNPSNDTGSVDTVVTPSADLSVTKSGPATITAGTDITYTVTVTNSGPTAAFDVSLADTPPAGTTFVSATQNSGPSFNCAGTIVCTSVIFPAGSTATFTFVFHVAPGATGSVVNTATIAAAASGDPNGTNNTSTSTATIASSADVSVTKSGPPSATTSSDVTYTITVTNGGPSDASAVSLSDSVPAGTTFVSGSQSTGPAFVCAFPAAGGTGNMTCSIATLTAGATATFSLTVHVSPTATGSVVNTATVTSTTADPTPANNSATATAVVNPGPTDVSITKTSNGDRFDPGAPVTYTITVTNNGPSLAAGVTVTDILPAGATLISATPTQGTCSGTTTVTCSLGTLNPLATATIALSLTPARTAGPVVNTATVTAINAETAPANNTSTATIQIAATDDIPTISPFGMLFLATSLAAIALVVQRRA